MKKLFAIFIFGVLFLFAQSSVYAQDTTSTGAINQIYKTSEQADKLYGKEIQKKNMSAKTFESLDTVAVNKAAKKNKHCKRNQRRHQ
ncbi:MAG: hypothetical protein ABI419_00585 [Ginsengibacter sp.]